MSRELAQEPARANQGIQRNSITSPEELGDAGRLGGKALHAL